MPVRNENKKMDEMRFNSLAEMGFGVFIPNPTFLYLLKTSENSNPAANYMFKVKNRNNRTRCEICPKFGVILVSLLLTLNIFHTLF